jgi:hypothetical protein
MLVSISNETEIVAEPTFRELQEFSEGNHTCDHAPWLIVTVVSVFIATVVLYEYPENRPAP